MEKRTNRLAYETSPYLLQHAHNPVDWFPWGNEALELAKKTNRPIFLSIGYSACHWCHVMERESFENAETAAILNKSFVSIKVDREERPDLDHIYMSAVQVMNRQGGWPLSVFLTPDGKPFYGGTYFPPEDRFGLPAFSRVIQSIAQTWETKKEDLLRSADQLLAALHQVEAEGHAYEREALRNGILEQGVSNISRSFDAQHGGFGSAPKFFHVPSLHLCLRVGMELATEPPLRMALHTLRTIAKGGVYDHLGGGFHRYSTDASWLVPHFEKMLYDNALLTTAYLDAYRVHGDTSLRETARDVLNYLLREMRTPEELFCSTQDADTDGEEGKFFVWSFTEIQQLLGEDLAPLFCAAFDVTEGGNWEGKNILHRVLEDSQLAEKFGLDIPSVEASLAVAKRKLLEKRATRTLPGTDDKALSNWNGLALTAVARGFQVLRDERLLQAGRSTAETILREMTYFDRGGFLRLFHVRKNGVSRIEGFLEDYAFVIQGMLEQFGCDFDPKWLRTAQQLAMTAIDCFWDSEKSIFYASPRDGEKLLTRPREEYDGAVPSSEAVLIECLVRLSRWLDHEDWSAKAKRCLEAAEPRMRLAPNGTAQYLLAADQYLSPGSEAVLILPNGSDIPQSNEVENLASLYLPRTLCVVATPATLPALSAQIPWLEGKTLLAGKPTLYWCERYACGKPEIGEESIDVFLRAKRRDQDAKIQFHSR